MSLVILKILICMFIYIYIRCCFFAIGIADVAMTSTKLMTDAYASLIPRPLLAI